MQTHTERHIHSMRNYTASERCSSWGPFVWGPVNGHKCCSQQQNNASFGINVVGTRASHGLANISSALCKLLSILDTYYGFAAAAAALAHLLWQLNTISGALSSTSSCSALLLYLLWIEFDYNSL